jgi:hypothetical protein
LVRSRPTWADRFQGFGRALKGKDVAGLSDEALLHAVYKERSRVDVYFQSLPPKERDKIRARFSRELDDVLKMAKSQPPIVRTYF